MPWWKGATPDQNAAVDRCVEKLTPKHGKEGAIRICIAGVRKAGEKKG